MGGQPTVGVHHQLAAGQAGVRLDPTQYKAAGGIDENLRVLIRGEDAEGWLDDEFQQFLPQLGQILILRMLAGEDDGGDPPGCAEDILHRHLRLSVRPQAADPAHRPRTGKQGGQAVGQHYRQWQEIFCFTAGVAINDPLVTGCGLVPVLYRLRDVRALGPDEDLHVETPAVVAGPAHRVAHDGRDIRDRQRGDLAGHHEFTRCRQNFTGDAGVGVMFQAAVQHGVRYGIAQLVRVARCDGLRCQNGLIFHAHSFSLSFWGVGTTSPGCTGIHIFEAVPASKTQRFPRRGRRGKRCRTQHHTDPRFPAGGGGLAAGQQTCRCC